VLAHRGGILLERYDGGPFSVDAITRFPTLREELEEDEGLLHLQMSTLARAVGRSVATGNVGLAKDIFAFVDQALRHPKASPEIENAVALSFIEPSDLRKSELGRTLLAGMPPTLKAVLLEQERLGGAS